MKVIYRVADYLFQQHQKLFANFSKFAQVNTNRAPHASSVKFKYNALYSIILCQFAKRTQITLELSQKVICYPLKYVDKSKQTALNNLKKVISGWHTGYLILNYGRSQIKFQIWVLTAILSMYKIDQNWAPHANLLAESADCLQRRSCYAIPLGEQKLNFKNGG